MQSTRPSQLVTTPPTVLQSSGPWLYFGDAGRIDPAMPPEPYLGGQDMPASTLIPADIQHKYEIYDWRHAAAILATEFPDELAEICDALRSFQLLPAYITVSGGNESEVPDHGP